MTANPKRRWVFVATLVGACGLGIGFAAEIEVSVALLGARAAEGPAEITLVAEPMESDAPAAVEYPVSRGLSMLDLPPDGRWRLRAQALILMVEPIGIEPTTS